jgi:hypothetical protein
VCPLQPLPEHGDPRPELINICIMACVATKRQPLPTWIEETVRLPSGVTANAGPIKLYPYQRGIAEAIADPHIERVTVLKSARIGYTAVMTAAIAHFVVREPSPILLMPTEARNAGRWRPRMLRPWKDPRRDGPPRSTPSNVGKTGAGSTAPPLGARVEVGSRARTTDQRLAHVAHSDNTTSV